jgi:ABC-type sugar transport system ATPase subunit
MKNNNDIILQMSNITKAFAGVLALNKVMLELKKGEIHALIGENGAGKSTLMKVLLGIYRCDSGEIIYRGKKINFTDPSMALKNGISMIHQEMSLVQSMTVAENIWLGQEKKFTHFGLLSEKKRRDATKLLFDKLEIQNIEPRIVVKKLTVAYMQLVELARAVAYAPDIIIMDEPTSALAAEEIKMLFKIMTNLSNNGVTIIFISHKLEEIFEICNRVTIMRDGHYIETRSCTDLTITELLKLVVGRSLDDMFTKHPGKIGDVVLEVKNFTRIGVFKNINFNIRSGEIVGFSGLLGAGRSEVMRSLFGFDKYDSGIIFLNGSEVKIKSTKDAVNFGLGMITEDRLRMGIIAPFSILYNTTIACMKKFCTKLGFISTKKEICGFKEVSKQLAIKYSSERVTINKLSGGNQQKVIISRWLITRPKILILDEPTRGIDVGSKSDIHKLIDGLAKTGIAIILVSSEMPELLGMCDRIYVMRGRKIVFQCEGKNATQELLAEYAFGSVKT